MKILVIGSKGFIGSHVTAHLLQCGHEVWKCDVVTDYSAERYLQVDATNADFNAIFEHRSFDVCINCSGAASVPDSLLHPRRDFQLNAANVFAMLNAIHQYNSGCRFINLSSAAVYGNPVRLPIQENSPMAPMSPYGYHKMQAEQILKEFAELYGEKTCSLRIFSAYGAGLKKQIFWDMMCKMSDSQEAVFWGTGEESRDFIHVRDITRVVELCIEKAAFNGETINVANGTQITIRQAVNLFAELYQYKGSIVFNGVVREGDPRFWEADVSIIQSWGYKPSYSLEQGLKEYIEWAKNV